MMGYGSPSMDSSNGNYGNFSSSSNLSALAPPFSITGTGIPPFRSSNPVNNSWHPLQYPSPNPSAPTLLGDHQPTIGMGAAAASYHFSPTTTTTSTWVSQPCTTTTDYSRYYSPPPPTTTAPKRYDPSGRDLSSQLDYIYDLDYGTSSWLPDRNTPFSSNPERVVDYGTNFKQHPTPSTVSKRDPHTTFTDMEDKTYLDVSFLASHSNTSPNNSVYSESQSHGLSSNTCNNFSGYQSAFSTYISPFTRPAPPTRPSSSVVIRPPPVNVGRCGSSPPTTCNENLSAAAITNFDLGQKSNSGNNDDSYDKDLLRLSKQGNSQSFVSSSVKEFSTPLNTSELSDKTSHVPQFPSVNVSNGFDTVQVVTAAELSSDSVDRHSIGVDSPCWRGVNSSQFPPLYAEDDFSSYYYKNSVDELYDIGHEMKDNICSVIDSTRTSVCVGKVNRDQETECAQNGVMQKVHRNLDAVYPSIGPNLSDDAKAQGRVSTRSIGVQIDKDPNMPIKESAIPNNWMNDFGMNNPSSKFFVGKVDTGLTLSDVSDGNIAVHAAEKVLASPSSQEDTAEGTRVQPEPKVGVTRIIDTMRTLSESLLLHLPNDSSTLDEKNTESLKLIIDNLSSCMSKRIIKPTNAPNPNNPVGDDSKIGESCNKITISDKPHKISEIKDSHTDRDYWSLYDEVGDVSGKKAENSPVFSSSREESYITGDGMAEAIKKVLDENLNLDEEIHPQALLFKSLWLEAEAKLCSISYRARFDQMKLQIEKSKPKTPLGKGNVAEKMAKNHISPKAHDAGIKPMIRSSYLPGTSSHAGDAEPSYMSRLSILKSRDDDIKLMNKEKQNSEVADVVAGDIVMARLKILKSRADNSKSLNVEVEKLPEIGTGGQNCLGSCVRDQPEDVAKSEVVPRPHLRGTGNHSEVDFGSCHKSLKELNSSMANDQMIHPLYDAMMMNQPYSGGYDSPSSSDWEHVIKDDFAGKNS